MKKISPYISVVIPLFNEESRINNLSIIKKYLSLQKYSWEIILVNDGSTDNTLQKLKTKKNEKVHILSYKENKGKGCAIKQGMLKSTGKYKLFLDIDLSTPIEQFDKFKKYLNKFDLIIGSRRVAGSKFITKQNLLRESMGRVFTKLSQNITGVNISDFTCGFKCFSKKAAEEIFSKQLINRWGFDAEILFIAKNKGYSIKELPVEWKNDSRSRVKFPQDVFTSLFDLFKIRINDLLKKY